MYAPIADRQKMNLKNDRLSSLALAPLRLQGARLAIKTYKELGSSKERLRCSYTNANGRVVAFSDSSFNPSEAILNGDSEM